MTKWIYRDIPLQNNDFCQGIAYQINVRNHVHPVQRAGFYLLQDNVLIGFEPDHTGTVRLKGEAIA